MLCMIIVAIIVVLVKQRLKKTSASLPQLLSSPSILCRRLSTRQTFKYPRGPPGDVLTKLGISSSISFRRFIYFVCRVGLSRFNKRKMSFQVAFFSSFFFSFFSSALLFPSFLPLSLPPPLSRAPGWIFLSLLFAIAAFWFFAGPL